MSDSVRETAVTRPRIPSMSLGVALGLGLAFAALGVVAVYVVVAPPLVGMDDANIGFRYARNLAEGHGFVFNPGGERVEGVTSLLWVALLAALYAVAGPGVLEALGIGASVLLTALALAVVLRLLSHFRPLGRWAGIAWLASLPAFYQWAGLALMDVALWAAAIHVWLALCLRAVADDSGSLRSSLIPVAVAVPLVVLARPDSTLVIPATVVIVALVHGVTPAVRRLAGVVLAVGGVSILGVTAARLLYFGYPLPNTYYTKVSPDLAYRLGGGLRYVGGYLFDHPFSLVPLLAGVAATAAVAARRRTGQPPEATVPVHLAAAGGLFVLLGFASAVVVGGDHFFDHRFLQAYLPLLALPLAWLAARVGDRVLGSDARRWGRLLAIVAALALVGREWRAPARGDIGVSGYVMALEGRLIGGYLGDAFPAAPPVVGVWQAGGIGYGYYGPVRDLLGLNWVAMGHSEGDRKGIRDHAAFNEDVFWSAPPDLMIPISLSLVESIGACPRRVWEDVLGGVMETARFEAAFEPVVVAPPDGEPIFAYGRTGWLDAYRGPNVRRPGWSACGVPPGP